MSNKFTNIPTTIISLRTTYSLEKKQNFIKQIIGWGPLE